MILGLRADMTALIQASVARAGVAALMQPAARQARFGDPEARWHCEAPCRSALG
jgi:hypothetical protein